MPSLETAFTRQAGCRYPIICGAMYPCSNPQLVAAASRAGALGIVQPVSLTYVHGRDFREGLRWIMKEAQAPIGLNLLIEKSSRLYLERNRQWMEIALEEGVRFFITALGNPDWVVEKCHAKGAIVYHDVTSRQWAEKAIKANVDGLICVNKRAGGHAGHLSPEELFRDLKDLGLPLICAGGIGGPKRFAEALEMGYAGAQLGTRFIATTECTAHEDYKQAILKATADDIVLTRKITGVPVAVINTGYIRKMGTEPGPLAKKLLANDKTKHLARLFYSVRSFWQLKRSLQEGASYRDYFQAGKSVEDIQEIIPAGEVVRRLVEGVRQ